MNTTIKVSAAKYTDHDNCLTAAATDYVAAHPEANGYDMSPRWEDDQRDVILLDVPVDGIRVFQGSETRQVGANGNKANPKLWYYEPTNYDGDVLWSDGYWSREEAETAAGKSVV